MIPKGRCDIVIGNALEQDYSAATCIFLYLTERGLRLIYPILREQIKHSFRVVTYMAPFQSNCAVAPSAHVKVKTTKHPIGEWPLYYYEFLSDSPI